MSKSNCVVCNQEFIKNKYSPKQIYCSKVCQKSGTKLNSVRTIFGNCKFCGNDIFRKGGKYCSMNCKARFQSSNLNPARKRKLLKCKMCDTEFEVMNYMKDITLFCSISCSKKFNNINSTPRSSKILKVCEVCETEFLSWPYRINNIFCSQKCHYSVNNIEKICKGCDSKFTTSTYKNKLFCSKKCSVKYYGPSSIENFIYDYIKTQFNLISITRQKIIKTKNNSYVVDFLLSNNIILEVFGDYWHCNPNLYQSDYYHKQIKKYAFEIWKQDNIKIQNLRDEGFKVFVLWENSNNKDDLIVELVNILKNINI